MLSDAALQDYIAAFSPGIQSWDGRLGALSKSHHRIFSMLTVQHDQSAFRALPRGERGDVKIENQSPSNHAEFGQNDKDFREEMTSVAQGGPAKDASSSVAASPVLEGAGGLNLQSPLPQVLDEGFKSEQVRKSHWVCVKRLQTFPPRALSFSVHSQLLPPADAPTQPVSGNETFRLLQVNDEGKSTAEMRSSLRSSLSPAPAPAPFPAIAPACAQWRLSSPEKILNLQEQLQKALTNTYQVVTAGPL